MAIIYSSYYRMTRRVLDSDRNVLTLVFVVKFKIMFAKSSNFTLND